MGFGPRRVLLLCLSFFVFLTLIPSSSAQTFSASITGVVTDPSGSVVQGAKVHLRKMDTNDTRDAVTNDVGSYKFDNLLPGKYEITAEAQGFKQYVQSNMILRANTAASVNVALTLGGAEQKVQVTGEAVLVDTESANNSVTLDAHLIESLPNSYRNPLNFVFALAGTTETQSGMTSRSNSFDQMGSMFGLNGGRSGNAQILIDGASSTAVDWGGLFVAPNNDAIQEQQVVQNVYDSQYERSGAGVVTLVTKGGSQAFHGEVYDYFRNSALDANIWSNGRTDPVTPKGLFHRNQFGVTFSGPISRSRRVFFFVAYEGMRQPDAPNSGFLTVPTQLERQGDFSQSFNTDGSPAIIYDPFSTTQFTDSAGNTYFTRRSFLDETGENKIPSALIDSVGQNIANLYPLPNLPGEGFNHLNNYYVQGSGMTANDKIDWRLDWEQSQKNRIFVRMSDRIRQNDTPKCFFCNGTDEVSTNNDHGLQIVLNDTFTPTPTWVMDVHAAYGRWYEAQEALGFGKNNASKIGLSPSLFQAPLLPLVQTDQYATLGTTYSSFDHFVRSNVSWSANITKEFSRHSLKFGANYGIAFMNNRQDSPGSFSFGRAFTACDAGPAAGDPCAAVNTGSGSDLTGDSVASMLLGTGGGYSPINMDPAMSLHTFGLYIQDQWRVNQRLTITGGLRYENQRPATERFNRLTYFDPNAVNPISTPLGSTVRGVFEYANKDNRYGWGTSNRNFAPRLGVAYKVTDKLVARVGGGLFYAPTSAMISFDSPGQFLGFSSTTNWIGTVDGYNPLNLVSDPFPNGLVQPVGNSQGALTQVGQGASQIWKKGKHAIGYSEQWSADLQYQLGSHAVIEAGYTGSRGHQLMYGNPNLDANQLPTADLALGSSTLLGNVPNPFYGVITDPNSALSAPEVPYNWLLRPFPEFFNLQWTRSLPGAQSAYDALNLKFTKQFSNGLSLISTYVWSKALDNGSEDFIGWTIGGQWRDYYNTKLDYSISTHDIPHSFATAWTYQLPYGRGKRWGSSAPSMVQQIVGNWEVSGVVRLSSGLPLLPVTFSYNPLSAYGFPGPGMPDVVGNPKPAHQTKDNWINPAAFAGLPPDDNNPLGAPFDTRYGNEPQHMSSLREAAIKNLDFAVAKYFGPERFRAQFRAEFLNAFNHPIYGGEFFGGSNIGNCIDCGNVGTVYGTRNDPRNIQLSLKLMF